jgi:Tfp pilus assembly protein PilF
MKTVWSAAGVIALVTSLAVSTATQHHDLGTVKFPTSCAPAVQSDFERGVAMLHSYWFNYAGKTFRGVLEKDPSCAMAYWGIALDLLGNTLAAAPSAAQAREAWTVLEKARSVTVKTDRERLWLEAIRAYFRDHDKLPLDIRLASYNKAMGEIAAKYPDDFEAQVFYALTLQAAASKRDLTYASQKKSADILEKLYTANPQHPGITHYLIHAYDYAPFADQGIAAARRYASIAPAVPHARHMPAHIYSMVGLWEDSITSNLAALEIQPDYYHASDFIVYAQLQLTRDRDAARMIEQALKTPERGDRPATIANYTALAAMPARYVLERGDWKGAAELSWRNSSHRQADALTHFARGLGMARTGNAVGARAAFFTLQQWSGDLRIAGDEYWADRLVEQARAINAWQAMTSGFTAIAIEEMRQAADGEDGSIKHVAMENRLYPMRELLGDILMEAKQPAAAFTEYVKAVQQHPNRFRALYGAGRSAEAAGDRVNATSYYTKLIALSKSGDGTRPEVQHAQAFMQTR